MNPFEQLIQNLGPLLKTTLQAEQGRFCVINAGNLLKIQLEYTKEEDGLFLATFLGPVSPGRFREEVFLAALKENGQENAFGTFSYSENKNSLTLHLFVPITIKEDKLAEAFFQLRDKGILWKDALEQNDITSIAKQAKKNLISPMELK